MHTTTESNTLLRHQNQNTATKSKRDFSGLGIDRQYKCNVGSISNAISHLESTKTNKHKTLVDVASDNAQGLHLRLLTNSNH